ncbi:hypothetical protein E0L36_11450 [Streptomyces sp. AJS327]|uniref:hypothetical protein n=1 Tax=Streptomyces sp. AJS327 TaxID=2545265 RepID=UPI0015DEAAB0|nr:hypothetical protein [Streptomyces sp. AJS327]MBA0051485.1 hypothetical protein [Streptomyces sp. AJS327]
MAALAWLLIPVTAAAVAALWSLWAGRRRTTTPDSAGVAGYERFRAAMERSRTDARPGHDRAGEPAELSGPGGPDGPARAAD